MLLAAPLWLPLFALTALAVLLVEGRPVFFAQTRAGLHGRPFRIVKFRSMRTGSGSDAERLGRFGRFLRASSLDELPELFLVLVGKMSLVGPRPEMMANVARYKMALPAFVYREKMKAGLTGYAQIEGRYNTSAEDKLMLDMMYIESFSIWLDVKLILRTFTILFKKDSTQGFQSSPGSNNIMNIGERKE